MVCSKCAEGLPSAVSATHSSRMRTSWPSRIHHRSTAITMPSCNRAPRPAHRSSAGSARHASWCRCRVPRTHVLPKNRSPRPGFAPRGQHPRGGYLRASCQWRGRASRELHPAASAAQAGFSRPATVTAESAKYPSTSIPKSMETMSPSFNFRFGDGIPVNDLHCSPKCRARMDTRDTL